jgi:hypothetical protein
MHLFTFTPKENKMKTLAELEMESPEGFRNSVKTSDQEALMQKMHDDRKEHESKYMAIQTEEDEPEEVADE